ncbi:transcriptional regulator swi6 [Ascosphaera atra]|nr:transcriptional regulator swi6 [Ascosphaera atra]
MATLVNAQDEAGDTPLNIAGRANTRLVPQLIELGANQWIANNSGLRPADYGVGADLVGSARRRGEVGAGGVAPRAVTGDATRQLGGEGDDQGLDAQGVRQKRKTEVLHAAIQEIAGILTSSIDEYAKELALKTRDKQAETRRWHDKIRESARQRQIEQKALEDLNKKHRRRIELERRIRNLENAMGELKGSRKKDGNGGAKFDVDVDLGNDGKGPWKIGDAERSLGIELERFKELFPDALAAAPVLSATINAQTQQPPPPDPMSIQPQPSADAQIEEVSHPAITKFTDDDSSAPMRPTLFTPEQFKYLTSLPSPRSLRRTLAAYNSNNDSLDGEIEDLKAKNTALGETYRRIVMACTGWTAKQVDEAAEGLTECVKEINESPVPEEEAIEILMRERGQDW